jgi:autotransporter-associated beta strand protein
MKKQGQRVRTRGPGALIVLLALALLVAGLLAAPALAKQNPTWDGGGNNNNWSTAANWVNDTLPQNGDTIAFQGSTRTTNYNDLLTSVASVSFSGGGTEGWDIFDDGSHPLTINGYTNPIDSLLYGMTVTDGKATWEIPTTTLTANGPQYWMVSSGASLFLNSTIATGVTIRLGGAGNITQQSNSVISGAGGLNKIGTGNLRLYPGNTYTGITTLGNGLGNGTSGTTFITAESCLGAPSSDSWASPSQLTMYGGVLDVNGTFTTSSLRGMMWSADGGSILVEGGKTLTWAGVIHGNNDVPTTKTGAGTMILTATNTHAGGFYAREGTVLVNGSWANGYNGTCSYAFNSLGTYLGGATVGGTGTISDELIVNGQVSPGASVGTLTTVQEDWQPYGAYVCELSDAGNDLLDVTGVIHIGLRPGPSSAGFSVKVQTIGTLTFDASVNHSWLIAQTTEGVENFEYGDTIGLDMSDATFSEVPTGEFWLHNYGNNIYLRYTHGTPVIIKSFKSWVRRDGKVQVAWRTAQQSNIAGFKLQRKVGHKWVTVGRKMIPAKRDKVAARYHAVDRTARAGRHLVYRLRVIELGGKAVSVGPYSVVPLRR